MSEKIGQLGEEIMCCINCLAFKMTKGWITARCIKARHLIPEGTGFRERLFKWDGKNGKNLIERSAGIVNLNQPCNEFENMDKE